MAQKAGLSQTAVVRIWHAFGLQPHRVENFKLSKDPQFVRGCGTLDLLAVDPGTTPLYSEPFPLVRWSWLSDGILRNFGTRWDQDLHLTRRLGPTLELLLLRPAGCVIITEEANYVFQTQD